MPPLHRPFIERIDSDCKDGTPLLNGAASNSLVLPENFDTGASEKGYKFHRVFNPEVDNKGVYEECYQESLTLCLAPCRALAPIFI